MSADDIQAQGFDSLYQRQKIRIEIVNLKPKIKNKENLIRYHQKKLQEMKDKLKELEENK